MDGDRAPSRSASARAASSSPAIGKFVLVAVGDDDTIQMIDTKTNADRRHACPPVPIPNCSCRMPPARSSTSRTRTTTRSRSSISRSARGSATCQVGVEPEGMAISPDGKILVNTSETTNMAHFIDTATRQIVANVLVDSRPRFAEFKQDGSELWVSSEIGGTVSVIDPAKHARSRQDHFRDSRPAARGDPAGRHRHDQRRQDRLRRARPGQPHRRHRRRHAIR